VISFVTWPVRNLAWLAAVIPIKQTLLLEEKILLEETCGSTSGIRMLYIQEPGLLGFNDNFEMCSNVNNDEK
jgi:hypothetical protein